MKILVALAITGLVSFARAYEIADQWSSVRAEGMGGAYTAVVNDSDALFYNPAGLAGTTKFAWLIADPRVGVDGIDNIKTMQSVISGGSDQLTQNLQQLYGKRLWLDAGSKSAILIPGFAMGAFVNTQAGVYVTNPANTTMNLNYFFDYGFAAGGGFEMVPGFMKFGIAARRFNRTGTTMPIGAATLATMDSSTLEAEMKDRGTGYAADLGLNFTLPAPTEPTLSLVYRNAGTTTFTHEEGNQAPPPIDPELIIGGAMKIKGALVDIIPAVDYRYANRNDIQTLSKLHIGTEVAMPFLSLRGGLNQGYYTAGVGFNLGLVHIDCATYGVELGAYPGQQEDRRYIAQFSFQIGFDPGSLGLGSSSGSSDGSSADQPHLKQRR